MIRIITDSTCEAPPEVLQNPGVTVLPLSVVFGHTALRDGIDITREQFWARLPSSNPLPTTSQANPADFEPLFRQALNAGEEVVAILLSGKLSGTLSSALVAQDSCHSDRIDVVDSRSVSVGLGLMVAEAARMAAAGATRADILAKINKMRDEIRIVFALETLEYLQRGGRIGKAQAFVGTLLKFKPLLGIVDGEVHPLTRVRSRAKALEAMQELLLDQVTARGPNVHIGVTHAQVSDEAHETGGKLAGQFGTGSVYYADLGPVLGVHVGPGTIGIATYAAD